MRRGSIRQLAVAAAASSSNREGASRVNKSVVVLEKKKIGRGRGRYGQQHPMMMTTVIKNQSIHYHLAAAMGSLSLFCLLMQQQQQAQEETEKYGNREGLRDEVGLLWSMLHQGSAVAECKSLRNVHEFYKIVEKPIGAGGFGVVCVGTHRETKDTVAIKQLPKKIIPERKVNREIEILRLAGEHRNIIGFRDVFQDDKNWYIVMEIAEGGELFDRLVKQGAYSESQASEIMLQIVEAVTYLHQQGIVHCDLKPENLLLANKDSDTSDMRLVDFGSAFRVDQGELVSRKGTGTIAYSAPEVISGKPCGYGADIWALGVLMYILLSGYHPFDPMNDADDDQIGERIVKEREKYVAFDQPVWSQISPAAKELIRKLLHPDVEKRPTAQELLHDPWIAAGTELSKEPLEESVENLRKFHRGRRRLKALMLAIMAGLANNRPSEGERSEKDARNVGGGNTAFFSSISRSQTSSSSSGMNNILSSAATTTGTATGNYQYVTADKLGSRKAAVRMLDPEKKGFVNEEDLARVLSYLGEEMTEKELTEMVLAGHGDPHTKKNTTVSHPQLVNLLPPLCPSKHFANKELLFTEGEIDQTYYLLQKGTAVLRFECPTDGGSSRQVIVENLKSGDTFGELEMMIEADGTILPRAMTCECTSPRCEVITIDDHLFSLLTDVFDSTHSTLRRQAEGRCRRMIDRWMENLTSRNSRNYPRNQILWSAEKRDTHKLYAVKRGALLVETLVEAAPASKRGSPRQQQQQQQEKVVRDYGPGSYVYTKELHGYSQTRANTSPYLRETCQQIKTASDTDIVEVPSKYFEDFLKLSRREEVFRFLLDVDEGKRDDADGKSRRKKTQSSTLTSSVQEEAGGQEGQKNVESPTL